MKLDSLVGWLLGSSSHLLLPFLPVGYFLHVSVAQKVVLRCLFDDIWQFLFLNFNKLSYDKEALKITVVKKKGQLVKPFFPFLAKSMGVLRPTCNMRLVSIALNCLCRVFFSKTSFKVEKYNAQILMHFFNIMFKLWIRETPWFDKKMIWFHRLTGV